MHPLQHLPSPRLCPYASSESILYPSSQNFRPPPLKPLFVSIRNHLGSLQFGDLGSASPWRRTRRTVIMSLENDHKLCAARKVAHQEMDIDPIWKQLRIEAVKQSEAEPYLASFLYATVLAHMSLEHSLAFHLANKLANTTLLSTQLFSLFWETFAEDAVIQDAIRADIRAFRERDPACSSYVHGMLNFKGFLACQAHRVAHRLWGQGRLALALALQNRISEVFQVDIHPGAKIGKGVLFDHATGVVIGETAVIGDNVSILHHVTLGGTGNCCGDRHPKVGNGVLIGAAAILLGPIRVGDGAKIGACSLVLIDVPSYTTAVGVPARILGAKNGTVPSSKQEMPALSMDHTSTIMDYMI